MHDFELCYELCDRLNKITLLFDMAFCFEVCAISPVDCRDGVKIVNDLVNDYMEIFLKGVKNEHEQGKND